MKNKTIKSSLIISLVIHLGLVLLLLTMKPEPKEKESTYMDVTVLDTVPLTLPKDEKKKQIVEQNEKSFNSDIPEDAKYLSRNNQKIAEETVAQQHGRFNNEAGQGAKTKGQNKAEPKKQHTAQKYQKSQKAPWEVASEHTPSGLPTIESLKPKFNWNKLAEKEKGVENPGAISTTDDYLKNTKRGAQTMLNTREFVYYSYYNRIKNQLQQYWEPKIKDKIMNLFRQGRKIASAQDRITQLRITLNSQGTLIGVAVVNQSGVHELDEAAIEAFKAAAPFPNPPKGIVDPDGTIKIDWSFIIEAQLLLKPHTFYASAAQY